MQMRDPFLVSIFFVFCNCVLVFVSYWLYCTMQMRDPFLVSQQHSRFFVIVYLCICLFAYFCICVFLYVCIFVFAYFCILYLHISMHLHKMQMRDTEAFLHCVFSNVSMSHWLYCTMLMRNPFLVSKQHNRFFVIVYLCMCVCVFLCLCICVYVCIPIRWK